jgi:hypothetical protein
MKKRALTLKQLRKISAVADALYREARQWGVSFRIQQKHNRQDVMAYYNINAKFIVMFPQNDWSIGDYVSTLAHEVEHARQMIVRKLSKEDYLRFPGPFEAEANRVGECARRKHTSNLISQLFLKKGG